MKLKTLLEGYMWERNAKSFGKPLPTLEDVKKAYDEKQKKLTEAVEIGAKVKVISPELADYNKTGIVQDAAPSGKFYMVKLKSGLAYFHESDLRVIG